MKNKRNLKFLSLIFVVVLATTMLSGCTSNDKSKFYVSSSTVCTYNEKTNTTRIDFCCIFENDTIYDVKSVYCSFYLFENSTLTENTGFACHNTIKANKTLSVTHYVVLDGKIDDAKFAYRTPRYDNLWNSYKVWWIIAIIVSVILALVYLLIVIVNDLEFDDLVDFISEGGHWIFWGILILFGITGGLGFELINWFPVLICGLGVILALLLCLLISWIKTLIDGY